MAQATSAMTPEEALRTVANVRAYREQLTARAAGLVWMVWGLALSFHAFAGVFAEFNGQGADVTEGGPGLMANAWALQLIALLVTVVVGGLLTNSIWKAHALETERTHAPWLPFAAGLGVITTLGAIVFATNQLWEWGPHGIAFSPLALLAGGGATTVAVLQRRRVSMMPGLLAALLLLNLFVFGRFLAFPRTYDVQAWGAAIMALAPVAVFTLVGVWTMRKG